MYTHTVRSGQPDGAVASRFRRAGSLFLALLMSLTLVYGSAGTASAEITLLRVDVQFKDPYTGLPNWASEAAVTVTGSAGTWTEATDDEGVAHFRDLPAGVYSATVTHPDFFPMTEPAEIDYSGGHKTLYIELTHRPLVKVVPAVPTINGTPQVGATLTAVPGAWEPSGLLFTYQWLRDGDEILDETKPAYKVTAADVGAKIYVRVTGTKPGNDRATMTSLATAPIAKGSFTTKPKPTVSGTAKVGKKLTVKTGEWKPKPSSFAYQWYRGDTKIKGATKSSYTLASGDRGKAISVRVTAKKAGYASASKTSTATKKVASGSFTKASTPVICGTVKIGKKLTIKVGTWKPKPSSYAYQWYRDGTKIKGATKSSYTVAKADKGKRITVKVTGKKSGYTSVTKASKATKRVV
ncbi:hypothetical protein [Tessaracoccus caeni]|uniref:hypothetical protein n=1 Tax=Tessaracoccus caeni TaxID=3031239 RepID=UPI0023D9F14D|nr:hypothetical protein [Tessaracoccus caeni]MDF1488707.1 hypothetical protein [Tessaracoccus caeni]